MSKARPRREFRRESFGCVRDWVHFCVEFDLKLCHGCRRRARIGIGAPKEWNCTECAKAPVRTSALPLHPDLWRALVAGEETETDCPVCRKVVPLRRCWISEDARRLYCAEHLRPIETADRLERAGRWLERVSRKSGLPSVGRSSRTRTRTRPVAAAPPFSAPVAPESVDRLTTHFASDPCRSCPHNGSAVYDGETLIEVDSCRRRCTTTPDALNCANVDH